MPKKRKTRKQKISIDQKRQVVDEVSPFNESSPNNSTPLTQQEAVPQGMTFSLPTHFHPNQTIQKGRKITSESVVISTTDYGYLANDLIKTALLSVTIVIAEILIRLFYVH